MLCRSDPNRAYKSPSIEEHNGRGIERKRSSGDNLQAAPLFKAPQRMRKFFLLWLVLVIG